MDRTEIIAVVATAYGQEFNGDIKIGEFDFIVNKTIDIILGEKCKEK